MEASSQLLRVSCSRRKRVTIMVVPSTSTTSRMRCRSSSPSRAIIPARRTASWAPDGSISWTMTTFPEEAKAWWVRTAPSVTVRMTW